MSNFQDTDLLVVDRQGTNYKITGADFKTSFNLPPVGSILVDGDIGVTVQPYDATIVVDGDIGVTVQPYDADTAKLDITQTFTALQTFNIGVDVSGKYTSVPISMGSTSIDCSAGNYFITTVSGGATFSVTNVPSSRAYGFVLQVSHTSGSISWFPNVQWPKGNAPTLTTGKAHLFVFATSDGGSSWRGSALVDYNS